jgi:hypothetical protein
MNNIHELVYSIQGIEDLAAILDVNFQKAFVIAQRIRDDLRCDRKLCNDPAQQEKAGTTEDTILEYDLAEIKDMIRAAPEYP